MPPCSKPEAISSQISATNRERLCKWWYCNVLYVSAYPAFWWHSHLVFSFSLQKKLTGAPWPGPKWVLRAQGIRWKDLIVWECLREAVVALFKLQFGGQGCTNWIQLDGWWVVGQLFVVHVRSHDRLTDTTSLRGRSTSTQSLMAEQIGTEALEHEDLLRAPCWARAWTCKDDKTRKERVGKRVGGDLLDLGRQTWVST